jgi:Cu(I)/Ag(I) efflux system protein CusF
MIRTHILIPVALLALLSACGQPEETAAPVTSEPEAAEMSMEEHSGMDHGGLAMAGDGLATAEGTIIEIDEDGSAALINHGPIEAIGMGAMAMRFGTLGGVDFTGFEPGDEVSFAVKVGRDGTARIAAICAPAEDGADCLEAALSER